MIVYVRSFWIKRLCPRVQLRNGLAYIYFLLCMKLYNANGSAGPFIFPCLLRLSHGQTYYQNFIFPTPGNRRQWLLQIELHHSARQKDSILCHRKYSDCFTSSCLAERKETILDTAQYIFKVHKVRYSRLILSPSYSYITKYKSRIRQLCTATRFCKSDIIWTMCPRSFIPISKIPFSF